VTRACVLTLALATCGVAAAQPYDSLWVSYSNNILGLFGIWGPERVMRIHPPDFNLTYPFDVESLKVRFFDGMGSWTDSVYTFRIYGGDGTTLLYESESLIAPRTLWAYYRLVSPLTIDSGDFYMGVTARTVSPPYAYPFLTTDSGQTTVHSFYGTPGAWQVYEWGEFFLYAYVCPCQVGLESEPAAVTQARPASVSGRAFWLDGRRKAELVDPGGRRVMALEPGQNDLSRLEAGTYLVRQPDAGTRKLVLAK
jgi:hypothetical protein